MIILEHSVNPDSVSPLDQSSAWLSYMLTTAYPATPPTSPTTHVQSEALYSSPSIPEVSLTPWVHNF